MTKKIKAIFMLCMALCVAAFAVAFAACDDGNGGDSSATYEGVYTFIIEDEDGNPLANVMVQSCIDTDCRVGTSNAQGVATIAYDEPVEAHVNLLSDGGTGLSFEDFNINKTQFEYTIVMK